MISENRREEIKMWAKAYWKVISPNLLALVAAIAIIAGASWLLTGVIFGPGWATTISVCSALVSLSVYLSSKFTKVKDQKEMLERFDKKIDENGGATRAKLGREAKKLRETYVREEETTRVEVLDSSLRRFQGLFLDISKVMEKDEVTTPDWFRMNGLKWIDLQEDHVYKRTELIDSLKREINEKPAVLLNAKSGAGKTTLALHLGYHILEDEKWENAFYVDLKVDPTLDKEKLVEFLITLNKLERSGSCSNPCNLVILDNVHLVPSVVRNLASTSHYWREKTRVLIIIRTSDDSTQSLLLKFSKPESDTEQIMKISNEKWGKIICGSYETNPNLGIINLGPLQFKDGVAGILRKYMEKKALESSSTFETLNETLCRKCGDSLRILSFVLSKIEEDQNLVIDSVIQSDRLSEVNICTKVNEYYDRFRNDLIESSGASGLVHELDNVVEKSLSILSILNTLEIPCAHKLLEEIINLIFVDSALSSNSINLFLERATDSGNLSKHRINVGEEIFYLYSLPHRSEAIYLYECRSTLKPVDDTGHVRIESILKKTLEWYRDQELPVPLIQIIIFANSIGLEFQDLPRFLKEEDPELIRLAIEQDGEITPIVMMDLDIWGIPVGIEVANAIRHMEEPWEGIGTLWGMYSYPPDYDRENPVFDAIVEIENEIAHAIGTSDKPWLIITEIDNIEPLMFTDSIQNAIQSKESQIAAAINEDPDVFVRVVNALEYLSNDAMIKAIATVIPQLETPWRHPEIYFSRIVRNASLRDSEEIKNAIVQELPRIAQRISENEHPSYIIKRLECIQELFTMEIRSAILGCGEALANELRLSTNRRMILNQFSWIKDLLEQDIIISTLCEILDSNPNDFELIHKIVSISELFNNPDIRKVVGQAVGHLILTSGNPRYYLWRLPIDVFMEETTKDAINNHEVLDRILSKDKFGLMEKEVEILELVLTEENREKMNI